MNAIFISAITLVVASSISLSAEAKDQSPTASTFEKLGKIVEVEACAKDFSQDVGETIQRLCGQAKAGDNVESETYLKDESKTSPEVTCKFTDDHFDVVFSGTPAERDVILTVTVDDEGQIAKITKDQLQVTGKACKDLANRIDKGGRIPASADTELCFDYYPSSKLASARDRVSCH